MKASTYLLSFALLMLPLAVWAEHEHPGFWQQRLFARSIGYEPGRQNLVHETGTFIPASIDQDLTLTPADNPVILNSSVTVDKDARLTFEAGTNIYTQEFSNITVKGELFLNGTKDNLVNVYTNHEHPSKTIWTGFTFEPQSTGNITYSTIRHGAPAVTCLENSKVNLSNVRLHMGETGLFTNSPDCILKNSIIHGVRDGIVTTLPNYTFTDSIVDGFRKDVLIGN